MAAVRHKARPLSKLNKHFAALALAVLAVLQPALAFGQDEDSVNTLEIVRPENLEAPTVVGYTEYDDPWESFNRKMFAFNDVVYRHALIPLSEGYTRYVPAPVRTGVGNIFGNLREPLHSINHGLQGEFRDSGTNLLRFVTNTTLGIAGIFDPATNWFGMSPDRTSFAETLTQMNVGAGPYLVLPLFGSTDLRGGSARTVEAFVNPIRFIAETPESTLLIGFDNFQVIAPSAPTYTRLRAESTDPYLYFRNQYLQNSRRNEEFPVEQE